MPKFLCEEMQEYMGMLYEVGENERLVQIAKSYLHHEMDRGAKIAGVKRICIHDLRHSAISLLLEMGFLALAIAERVGHESKILPEPVEKIAARNNMFYDESGNHEQTKKKMLDKVDCFGKGVELFLKARCMRGIFLPKKTADLSSDSFMDEAKRSYTGLISIYVMDDKEKLKVFDKNGVYLPMKKVGKNNTKAE